MKKLIFLVFILIQSATGWSQVSQREFLFPVNSVDYRDGQNIQVRISFGSNVGMSANQEASVWGLHYSDYPTHNESTLANGTILEVSDTLSIAVLTEVDTATVKLVYVGDLLQVKLKGKDGYQGIFYDLIANSIYFQDQNGAEMYSFFEVFNGDSEAFEFEMLQAMSADIRTLAEYLEGTFDDQALEGGLFDGSTMLTAMKATTDQDVLSFLRYVVHYPRKYLGKSWKISETYATWLINATPLSPKQVLLQAEQAKDNAERQALLDKYGALFNVDMVLDAGIEAENMAEAGLYEEAIASINGLNTLTELTNDPDKMGWSYFQAGRIHNLLKDYKTSVEWYLKSIEKFESTSNSYALTYAYNNAGSAFNSLGDFQNSITYYKKALDVKAARLKENRTEANQKDMAIGEYRLADNYFDAGDFANAFLYFGRAKDSYVALGDLKYSLEIMEEMADAKGKGGDLEAAIAIHKNRVEIAQKNGWTEVVADAHFDMAYTYNGIGSEFEKAIPFYQKSYELHLALADTSMATLSISNVAQSYWSLKKLDLSISNHQATIKLAKQFGEKQRLAYSWDKLADLYAENGNPKKSLEAYDEVIALYEEMNDSRLAETLNEVGDVYKSAKDYIKAISYFRRSAEMGRKHEDFVASSDAFFDIADTYYVERKYDLSRHFYEESMRDAAMTDYPSQEIYCLANLALIYGIQDQYAKSDSLNEVALRKSIELNDDNILAYSKYRLAGSYSRKRDYVLAEKYFEEALALYNKLDDKKYQVILTYALAGIYANRGEFDQALNTYDKGLAIAETNSDRNNLAYGNVYKSDLYLRILGEFDKAWEMQQKSFDIFLEVDNEWGIADSYLGFGNIKNLQGENVKAIRFYEKSDSLYARLGNEYARATPMNNMGTIYYAQRDYEKALGLFSKAISILDKLGIQDASRTLYVGNIGEVKMEQGEYEEAEKWLMQALNESREINDVNQISTTLVILGRLKTETKDFDQAGKYLRESLELQQKMGLRTHEISSRFSLGKLAYLRKEPKDFKYLNESVDLSIKMGYEKKLWEAYYYLGLIAQEAGNLDESKELFINAIESMEKLQSTMVGGDEAKKQFGAGDKQIKVYAALVDVLILKGEVKLGMQYLERSNTEALRSKFSQLDIKFKDDEANEKLARERELKMKLDNLDKALIDEKSGQSSIEKLKKLEESKTIAESEYLKFVNTTINTNPELSRHFSGGFHPRKLKTDKNRQLIPKELVMLSYLPADDKLYIFAATSDTVIAKVVNVSMEELNKNIKYLYNFASHALGGNQTDALRLARGDESSPIPAEFNTTESKYKEISEQLFNWTIAPVRAELNKKEKVVVIPTGMLHFLPFQMLGEELPNGKFDFLIEHYTLFYAHSLEMLYQQRDQIGDISILAMANADQTLPAAEQEVNDLKSMYPNTDVFIHEAASEDKAKSSTGKHNILHFATHGNLDYFDYHKSYLTLAPNTDGSEDGKLTIEEVWEIEDIYSYQMVTLSACKTAVAEDFNNGWAVSPATSFIDAGAPTVVASLWAVNDESTSLLMKYFYRNLSSMSKVEALRRAQIELSQNAKFSHPYYWSPFILIGDWR